MKESTCVYLIHDQKWLMLYRNRKKNDVNAGKYIGVGGKREQGETVLECAMREVREETGLIMKNPQRRGKVLFSDPRFPDEKIWIFTCMDWKGDLHEDDEGTLVWVNEKDIMNLDLWEGDRLFLKKLLRHENREFRFQLFYDENGNLLHWEEREDTKQ